jgi:hypothetical protein
MEIFGIGLHILVALFFAIHAVRNGHNIFWLLVLFSFPLLGSLVYFVVIYLPNSGLRQGARKAASVAAQTLDPNRALREARDAFDYTPTAQNQMRLAAALLEKGDAAQAAQHYEACLSGPFAADLEIRLGAARAQLAAGNGSAALSHMEIIRRSDAHFRPEPVALLTAQALAAAGRDNDARAEYAAALERFGSFECRAEYAIWAASHGEPALALELHGELDRTIARWSRHTHDINADLLQRLQSALAGVR